MNQEYRFLLLDGATPPSEMNLVCLDDEAALLMSERFAQAFAVQVWDGGRLVGETPASGVPVKSTPAAVDTLTPPDQAEAAEVAPWPAQAAPARRHKPFWAGAWRRGLEQKRS